MNAPALTTIVPEVTLFSPVLVKTIVLVSALGNHRLVYVATPAEAATLVVPCSVLVPVPRAANTVALLVVHTFPN